MKIVIIYCVKAFYNRLQELYKQADVNIYSEFDVKGHDKDENSDVASNWFASGKDYYDSITTFAFVEEAKAEKLLQLIDDYNAHSECKSPIHGYMLNVEKSV